MVGQGPPYALIGLVGWIWRRLAKRIRQREPDDPV